MNQTVPQLLQYIQLRSNSDSGNGNGNTTTTTMLNDETDQTETLFQKQDLLFIELHGNHGDPVPGLPKFIPILQQLRTAVTVRTTNTNTTTHTYSSKSSTAICAANTRKVKEACLHLDFQKKPRKQSRKDKRIKNCIHSSLQSN